MQAHQVGYSLSSVKLSLRSLKRLVDNLDQSASLKRKATRKWLQLIAYVEKFWSDITTVILPDLARAGSEVVSAKTVSVLNEDPLDWPSVYTNIDVIVNQETPLHEDAGSALTLLDLLVSLGSHDANSLVPDLGEKFLYLPGTMIFLAGKILSHSVPKWGRGERIAIVHYMKDRVHDRLQVTRPTWTVQRDIMSSVLSYN
ncbi:hypothetical protein F5J12DRAFT_721219 [Pisolithus orientalis]|uniref:uncharacterized protein n=1 Tax=Pisolithus orientalis TaxID=936130 RepID=UPI00222473D4|nr:uncharacterized protein F5J12DRAFT_721219 [Pisolithus orientalis]KAI6006354.1 hypothetical protein F5J12DRAFT_721219 [Pisolithus orientalis]